jgi:hypothetical protein
MRRRGHPVQNRYRTGWPHPLAGVRHDEFLGLPLTLIQN